MKHFLTLALFFSFSLVGYCAAIPQSGVNFVDANNLRQGHWTITIMQKKLPNYKEYLSLPMFNIIIRLLQKGIAIHHAGIPQVFREMIELLFDKGYVKLLFATETFAIGINMPTKTVIFTSLKKYDGNGFRYLYSHEYTQAAGRAGRRGLDTVGYIYHLTNLFERKDESPNTTEYIKILNGKPQTLVSKFQIHFNILLNLISTSKKCPTDNMINFVSKSMMNDTILKEKNELTIQIKSIKQTIDKRNNILNLTTPVDIMKNYIEYQENANMYHRKKKKQMHKQITQWKNIHQNFTEDINNYKEIYNMEKDLKRSEKNYESTNNFISSEINNMLNILSKNDFILKNDDCWSLGIKGMIAANLQEMHPLAFTELLLEGIFNNHDTIDIITIISCFTNVSVPKQYCVINIDYINCDDNIKSTLKKMKNKMNKFYDIELQNRINNIDNYDIHWNMCELIHKWCHSENEEQCKKIYGEAEYYGISIGEFVKAILKINAIGLELEKVCLIKEDLELLEKCKKIPLLTLKSIATNQSLYL